MDWVDFTAKTVDDAITDALIKLETTSDNVEVEVIEKESNGILGLFAKPAKIRVRVKNDVKQIARNFLEKLLKAMNVEANIEIDYDELEGVMQIDLSGDDMGVLIGKRGQTLDSLQVLTSTVVNKHYKDSYLKVKLDTENYRERRRETLENLAKNLAFKVKRTKKQVVLEPMNPYERRIIHSALQYDKFVETHSEGEEPYRKVVITLKKNYKTHNNRTNSHYKSYNNQNKTNKTVNTVVD
ncbi:MAG: RNA-binding cell elongation regulator Jag/EloR [bacterium]|nr:RNA-binding cell elongation regulator Jag/EloR [bacterium]